MVASKELLVLDIETTGFDINKDKLRIIGFYSVDSDTYHILRHDSKNKVEIQKIIDEHRCIITFNGKAFDIPFMESNGYNFKYKIQLDVMEIFKYKRTTLIKFEGFKSYSLKNLSREVFNLSKEDNKSDIDYKVFQKEEWSEQEKSDIITYLKRDLDLTLKLWKFLEQHFEAFKTFISEKDIKSYTHIKASAGSYAYSAICNMSGLEPKYSDDKSKGESFEGGFVAEPLKMSCSGSIKCYDFKSAYPHAFMQLNLYTEASGNLRCNCCKDEELFRGNEMFPLKGKYCSKKMGRVEENIKQIFAKRKELGKGNALDKPLKVLLNCFSEDTEVLTENGIKLMKDVNTGEKLYSLNMNTKKIELKKVTDKIFNNYDGDMYHFHNRGQDLLVTPNHKMIVDGENYKFIEAQKLITGQNFPKKFEIESNNIEDKLDLIQFMNKGRCLFRFKNMYKNRKKHNLYYNKQLTMYDVELSKRFNSNIIDDDIDIEYLQINKKYKVTPRFLNLESFAYILGIYIAEGCLKLSTLKQFETTKRGVSKTVVISQSNTVNYVIVEKIKKHLEMLGITYKYYKKVGRFQITNETLYNLFEKCGIGSYNKKIPDFMFKYNKKILEKLHEGLYDGDGCKNQYKYITVSKQLRDDMIKLNFFIGFRANYKKYMMGWAISRPFCGSYNKLYRSIIKNPTNKVVCVTVEDNHTVIAGRNGRFHHTGQTIYGISSKPCFYWLYNMNTASDCTLFCRQSIKYARKKFQEAGYEVLYSDTDSVYVNDIFNDNDKINLVKEGIMKDIKDNVLFPQDTFIMELEADISYLQFFANNKGDAKKKQYLYITKQGKVVVKGLNIIQKDSSELCKSIFERLKSEIIKNNSCKFSDKDLFDMIKIEIYANPSIIAKRFNLKDEASYNSETSQYFKLFKVHGEGEILLIPNYRRGVGDSVKYCGLEEIGSLLPEEICLSNIYEELAPFAENGLKYYIEREKVKRSYMQRVKIPITQTLLKRD